MRTTLDGSTPPELLYSTEGDLWEAIATRSGDTLVTRELRSVENDRDLVMIPLRPAGSPTPAVAGPRVQAEPALSPDGKWLAYASEESGEFEVYIRAFPGPGPRYQASAAGGTSPRWNPRGGELFFLSRDSLFAVPVTAQGGGLALGRARALFPNRFITSLAYHAPYDVAPDGSWFVFVGGGTTGPTGGIRIVLNWFDRAWPR
jgi:serine/threonine-protein kinase